MRKFWGWQNCSRSWWQWWLHKGINFQWIVFLKRVHFIVCKLYHSYGGGLGVGVVLGRVFQDATQFQSFPTTSGWRSCGFLSLSLPFVLSHISCAWLFANLWTVALQAPLSMGFSRQEYRSGLPCPPPGDLPDPGIEPVAPALQADSLPMSHQGAHISLLPTIKSRAFESWTLLGLFKKSLH